MVILFDTDPFLKIQARLELSRSIYPKNFKEVFILEDKKIICKDCGKEFIFSVGEQEFFKEKGFENDPVRCPECRRAKKAQRANNHK